jgi:hypothetical protein
LSPSGSFNCRQPGDLIVAEHPDSDYLEAIQKEVASMGRVPTLEEIHKITSKDPTSWAEAIIAEREERF